MGQRPLAAAALLAIAVVAAAEPSAVQPRGRVAHVVDGDTIVVALDGRDEHVRLIGIDAPELHESEKLRRDVARSGRAATAIQAEGARARAALAALLAGRTVAIERDVESRDRFGRLLAWVWLDDRLVNEALVRDGWARLYTHPPNVRHTGRLEAAQRDARSAGRGVWAPDASGGDAPPADRPPHPEAGSKGRSCPPSRPVKGNVRGRPGAECIYHLPGFAYYAETRPERCFADEAEARAAGCRRARR